MTEPPRYLGKADVAVDLSSQQAMQEAFAAMMSKDIEVLCVGASAKVTQGACKAVHLSSPLVQQQHFICIKEATFQPYR